MHEMSLMENLLRTAGGALQPYRVARVNELQIRAGILANVLPDAFDFAFETLSQGTPFAGARLLVEKAPLIACCKQCGQTYESMEIPPQCSRCGSKEAEITGGTEVLLTSIDFEEEDER